MIITTSISIHRGSHQSKWRKSVSNPGMRLVVSASQPQDCMDFAHITLNLVKVQRYCQANCLASVFTWLVAVHDLPNQYKKTVPEQLAQLGAICYSNQRGAPPLPFTMACAYGVSQ